MSDAGFILFDKEEDFDAFSNKSKYSEHTSELLDREIKDIVDAQYKVATNILKREKKLLDALSQELLKNETLNEDEFMVLVEKFGSQPAPIKAQDKALSVTDWIKERQNKA
jgi:ATP-dependent Zn protease